MAEEELKAKIAFFDGLNVVIADDEEYDEGLNGSIEAFTAHQKRTKIPNEVEQRPPTSATAQANDPVEQTGAIILQDPTNTPIPRTIDAKRPVDLVAVTPVVPILRSAEIIRETPIMSRNTRRVNKDATSSVLHSSQVEYPAPRASLKRKKSDMIRQVPIQQRIFNDLFFFFIPNNDVSMPRRLRIRKAMEFGAHWVQQWSSEVTHVIVDNGLDFRDVLRTLNVSELPTHVHLVKENYPADCISFRLLLDPKQRSYELQGAIQKPINVVQRKESVDSSVKSLQLKAAKGDHFELIPRTPSRTEESIGSSIRVPSLPQLTTLPSVSDAADDGLFKVPSLPLLTTIPSVSDAPDESIYESCKAGLEDEHDPLQQAIAQAKATKHLLLESDDEDSAEQGALDEGSASGNSGEESGAETKRKRASKKKSKQAKSATTWQDNFTCMKGGKKDTENPNDRTIEVLHEMCNYYESTQDHWRSIAYRKAIASLRNQSSRVVTKEDAETLPFIGTRLAAKIEEIVWTNRLRRLENAKAEPTDLALQLFLKIYGVGFSQATKWIQQGLKTTDDLLQHAKLTINQRIGIDHLDDFEARIPRAEVAIHGEIVKQALLAIDPAYQLTVGGSYRRGTPDSGDIDIVITRPDTAIACIRNAVLEILVPQLFGRGYLTATLAATSRAEGTKWHGACQLSAQYASDASIERSARYGNENGHIPWRRIDFLLVPWDEMGAAMIYFTGDDIFNRSMRLLARKKNMRLNQRGLYKDVMRRGVEKLNEGMRIEGKDEREIFRILGVPWREPTARIC